MSRLKRSTKHRNYAKLDSYGFTSSDNDVLDLTDPNSGEFDVESDSKSVKNEIEKIIEKSIKQDERVLHELQGARPKTDVGTSKLQAHASDDEIDKIVDKIVERNERASYELQGARPKIKPASKLESSAPKIDVPTGSAAEKKKDKGIKEKKGDSVKSTTGNKKAKKADKTTKKKGEVNLNDLRANKTLSKLVETQLSNLLLGKISLTGALDSDQTKSDSTSDSSATEKISKKSISKVSKHKHKFSKKEKVSSDSSMSSSDSEKEDSSDSSSSSNSRKRSKKRHKRKKKSGMIKRASDDVVNPQIWPHSLLQYEYVSKSVKYRDLDFRLFVAGELEIITSKKN